MLEAIGRRGVLLVAASAFALASVHGSPVVSALFALSGLVFSLVARRAGSGSIPLVRISAVAAVLAVVFGWGTRMAAYPPTDSVVRILWLSGPLCGALLMIVSKSEWAKRAAVGLVITGVTFASAGILIEYQSSEIGTDVYLIHVAASEALETGDDPYSEAVEVVDGSPFAEPGSAIVGYPYPPVSLVGYAGAGVLLGDPRWMSLIAHLSVLVGLGWIGLRRNGESAFAAFLVFGAFPNWRMVEFSAWTEPLTLALFTAAAAVWVRSPALGGFAFGLALVSKQYLVVLVLLAALLVWEERGQGRGRRQAQGLAVGVLLGVIPLLFVSLRGFFDAAIRTPATLAFRPDSQSLVGLAAQLGISWSPPAWLGPATAALIPLGFRRRLSNRSQLLAVVALTLGWLFLLTMAFPNYWYLVMGLTLGAVAFDVTADVEAEESNMRSHFD